MKNKIEIYTDGSCKGNPGPGGWAALFFEQKKTNPFKILKGHDVSTTNNRMEMTALIEALNFIHENHLQNEEIAVYSDSNLLVQTLLQGWKRKANKDLWNKIDELNEELEVEYIWVKAHAQNTKNNQCDKIAQEEALKAAKISRMKAYPKMMEQGQVKTRPKKNNNPFDSEKSISESKQQKLF